MNPRSLRFRSTVAAVAAIALSVGILGLAIEIPIAQHLRSSLDRSLRARSGAVASLSSSAPGALTRAGALDAPGGGDLIAVEVFDRSGHLVAASQIPAPRHVPQPIVQQALRYRVSQFATVSASPGSVRVYAAPLDAGFEAAGGAVVTTEPVANLEHTLTRVRLLVVGSAVLAAMLGGLAVAAFLGKAMQPLRTLSESAAEIERTGDVSRGLAEPSTGDELERLSRVLNAMLAGLERSRESERRFLAEASHELRTPLTSLRGNVDYLMRHGPTNNVVAELDRDTDRLQRLAANLLTLAHEEAAPRPVLPVNLEEIAKTFAGPDITLDLDPARTAGDPDAIERAVANLIENARNYGEPPITVSTRIDKRIATLSVSDSGPGISPGDSEHMFERFQSGSNGGGTGLGLAIVRATAIRHGGSATIEGATVSLHLPAFRDARRGLSQAETALDPDHAAAKPISPTSSG